MLEFLRHLSARYRAVLSDCKAYNGIRESLNRHQDSLQLAEAFLEKAGLIQNAPQHPLQIAVIGPTQSGKSSIVNLILTEPHAKVSPLAGFTTYPQGFSIAGQNDEYNSVSDYFRNFKRLISTDESQNQLDCYSLTQLTNIPAIPACTIWDTPDFDSIQSDSYQNGLLRTIALADIVLLVISKDKYADQTVWDMMSMIEALNQPTLICLNKIQQESLSIITASLTEKWQQSRSDTMPTPISLAFFKGGLDSNKIVDTQNELCSHIKQSAQKVRRDKQIEQCHKLIKKHWNEWVSPLRLEQQANSEWETLVAESIEDVLVLYRSRYLDHPQHFETFQRALAELLALLEIPLVAPLLIQTRKIITWPIRQILNISQPSKKTSHEQQATTHEIQILEQLFHHFILHLTEAVLSKRDDINEQRLWWNEISTILKQQRQQLEQNFIASVQTYHKQFQSEIESTARHLLKKLEDQPATLNSLRATRFTTDAAAIAVSLKTGGIGLQDFILTPAMLSLTSYLTEGALGTYMNRVTAELKQTQYSTVKDQLFNKNLSQPILLLRSNVNQNKLFAIDKKELEQAEEQLRERRYGLRIY